MRAKLRIGSVIKDSPAQETLHFHGVSKCSGYPEDGSDEDNTYAKFSPCAELKLTIANPALIGKFQAGQVFYVDFTEVPAPVPPVV
ncbi:MAG: hypothetical protein H2172_12480 [Opitutus sp.]|nr:hypothetical protein [Opitutus sp.]MCS6248691.1 hypothetical protein [Opitutus sp.]MCS6275917.1 hypothetical protein [Opitutus sp.]MCS6301014.1 hypothetical protein [Opitutus sp.]